MYFNNAGWLLSALYPSLVWKQKVKDKVLFLTFDDGPVPDVTEYVLKELSRFSVRATFFCVGDNIRKHPHIFSEILQHRHHIGNHTFHHLKGWKTEDEVYLDNIRQCEEIISQYAPGYLDSGVSRLFRPPYGLIRKSQVRKLKDRYRIIMWDVLTGDFNKELSPEKCLQKAIRYTQKGSIIIFHDSLKAEKNLRYVLPRFLEHFLSQGYSFEIL